MPFKEPVRKTLRAQWLGYLMRQFRRERGMTLIGAAEYLQRDHSALARYERAEWPFKRDDVLALLDIYGVDDAVRRSRILKLAEECWRVNEWDIDNADEVFNRGYVDHTWLEQHAKTICAYATQILPDLVQTPAYTARVIQLRERTRKPTEHQARQVERRTARRHAFNESGTSLDIVIDEAVLHTTAPEPGLMRDQFAHLADLTRNPRVTIRVLPADVTIAARAFGPFEVFLMPDPYPEVGYLDNLAGHIYVEAPHSKRFVFAYEQLRDAALDPAESAKMIMIAARDA
ncbi:helix-turn-helix domain-containing protein [Polymorphospora rubra]|uniref:Transcriptional regulator n=1 Tax=Polymorphospora rubra TaxID=338584 RepID=A0A810MX23_9ACTN|nr:helix-turn-helix transcriptional regulator [Polymorphospora rubra]BCJ65717.1 transcriptional regulator [Polymorphospora rubra]